MSSEKCYEGRKEFRWENIIQTTFVILMLMQYIKLFYHGSKVIKISF